MFLKSLRIKILMFRGAEFADEVATKALALCGCAAGSSELLHAPFSDTQEVVETALKPKQPQMPAVVDVGRIRWCARTKGPL